MHKKDSSKLMNIITNDGNEYIGTIILQTENELKLKTIAIGTITLKLSDIKKVKEVTLKDVHGNEIWRENPLGDRYFSASSGYTLRKGEGYYLNYLDIF